MLCLNKNQIMQKSKMLIYLVFIFVLTSCSTLPNDSTKPQKNVIFILSSSLSTNYLSFYNKEAHTNENIDLFFKNGIVYKSHFTNSRWPFQSIVSLNTGKMPNEHQVLLNKYHNQVLYSDSFEKDKISEKLMSEYFKESGYSTLFVGGVPHGAIFSKGIGYSRGVDKFIVKSVEDQSDIDEIISFIEKSEKPFFLNINSVLTHFPYFFLKKNLVSKSNYKGVLPKNYEEFELLIEICFKKLDVKKCPIKFERYSAEFHQKYELSTNEYKLLIYLLHDRNKNDLIYFDKVYRDAVAYLDSLLGRLFKYLNESGLKNNTIVVLTSDVGQTITEGVQSIDGRNEFLYGYSTYNEEVLKVPFLVYLPEREVIGAGLKEETNYTQSTSVLPLILNSVEINNEFNEEKGNSFYSEYSKRRDEVFGLSYRPHKGLETYMISSDYIIIQEENRSFYYDRKKRFIEDFNVNRHSEMESYFKKLKIFSSSFSDEFLNKLKKYNRSYRKNE